MNRVVCFLGILLAASVASRCISKGDTNVGAEPPDPEGGVPSGADELPGADDDTADDDVADDDTADDDVADDDTADDDVADDDTADDDVADDDTADDDVADDDTADDDTADDDTADDDAADDDVADDDTADDDVADDDTADDDAGADDDTADDDVADDDAGADDDTADDDVADDDAGADDDTAGDDDLGGDDDVGETFKLGAVALAQSSQCIQGVGCFEAASGVASYNMTTARTSPGCEFTTVGDCEVYACDPDVEVEPATATQVNAGTITVTGFSSPLPLTWMEQNSGYMSDPFTSYLWQTPVNLTVDVSGSDDVPAYSMQLTTPALATLTAPVLDSNFQVSRSTDLEVTWTDGDGGTFQFTLTGVNAPDSYSIICNADASAGSLTVDAAALAGLPDEAGVGVGQYTAVTQMVGDWSMVFEAVHRISATTTVVVD